VTDDIDWPPVDFNPPFRGVSRDKVDLPEGAGAYGYGDDPPYGPVNLEAMAIPFLQQPVYCEPARRAVGEVGLWGWVATAIR
jgi:hypothetical protein